MLSHLARLHLVVAILASLASAQSPTYLYSWPGCDTTEGNRNNTIPFFGSASHYQQMHNDIKGSLHIVKGLSFRRDGTISITSPAKTITGQFWCGAGVYNNLSGTFARNYNANGRTEVIPANTSIQLPAMPPKPATPPAKFTAHIPFKKVYLYGGKDAFVWECDITKMSSSNSYIMDAHSSSRPNIGTFVRLGTGCIATSQTRPMVASAFVEAAAAPDRFRYDCQTSFGTKSAAAAILIGFRNPNLAFPTCNKRLYTDAVAMIPATSNAWGYFSTGSKLYQPYVPVLAGKRLYTQTYTLDAGQKPLPVAVSNGVDSIIPSLPKKGFEVARIYTHVSGGKTGDFSPGFSLATRIHK